MAVDGRTSTWSGWEPMVRFPPIRLSPGAEVNLNAYKPPHIEWVSCARFLLCPIILAFHPVAAVMSLLGGHRPFNLLSNKQR